MTATQADCYLLAAEVRQPIPTELFEAVATQDAEVYQTLFVALPERRTLLASPWNPRRVLRAESYPKSIVEACQGRAALWRKLQIHWAIEALLPPATAAHGTTTDTALPFAILPSWPNLSVCTQTNVVGTDFFQTPRDTLHITAPKERRIGVMSLATNRPTWHLLTLPPNLRLSASAADGRWLLCEVAQGYAPWKFQLFERTPGGFLPRFTDTFAYALPKFTADGKALLYADTTTDHVRLHRRGLGEEDSEHLVLTTHWTATHPLSVLFSPQGLRALLVPLHPANTSAPHSYPCVYNFEPAGEPTRLDARDINLGYWYTVWGDHERRLILFYPDDKRATHFALQGSSATKRTFSSRMQAELQVEACNGDRVLTVRREGGGEVWQLFDWAGQEDSAPLALPRGSRDRLAKAFLVGHRALFTSNQPDINRPANQTFVDFAASPLRPLTLSHRHRFVLPGGSDASVHHLVGEPLGNLHAPGEPMYHEVVSTATPHLGAILLGRVPYDNGDVPQVRADGGALFVSNPDRPVRFYRLPR